MAPREIIIPHWIHLRLEDEGRRTDADEHRYEASWYGPINKLANVIFGSPEYMVKPQPKLRETVTQPVVEENRLEEEGQFEEEGHSIDSMGTPVTSDKGVWAPDFIIVKVDENNPIDNDLTLVCIEVKKAFILSQRAAIEQLRDYIARLAKKNPHKAFRGILVMGSRIWVFNVDGRKFPTPDGDGWHTTPGLQEQLLKIVKEVEK